MSFILLLIGLFFLVYGRLQIGEVDTEGLPVRAAGGVLMAPYILTLLFDPISGSLLQLILMAGAVGTAYYILFNATNDMPNVISFPSSDEDKTDSSKKSENNVSNLFDSIREVLENASQGNQNTPRRPRQNYPSVMTLKQAASYLKTDEDQVLRHINDGKLAASKDMGGYRISKMALDDFISENSGSGLST